MNSNGHTCIDKLSTAICNIKSFAKERPNKTPAPIKYEVQWSHHCHMLRSKAINYDDSWTCVKFKYHSKQGTRLPRTGHIQAKNFISEEMDINSRNIHPIDPSSQHKYLLWKHLLFHRLAGVSHHHNYVHMKQPLHPPIEHPYNQKNHPCNQKTSCLIALNCENKKKTKLGSVHWPQICITMFELNALQPKSILK